MTALGCSRVAGVCGGIETAAVTRHIERIEGMRGEIEAAAVAGRSVYMQGNKDSGLRELL